MSMHYDILLYVCYSFIPRHSPLPYTVQVLGTTLAAFRAWLQLFSFQFSYLRVGWPFLWYTVYFEPLRILAFTKYGKKSDEIDRWTTTPASSDSVSPVQKSWNCVTRWVFQKRLFGLVDWFGSA